MKMTICLLAICLCGCAHHGHTPPKKLVNAPVGYKETGLFKYRSEDGDDTETRQEAFNKMAGTCGGKYRIVDEWEEKKFNVWRQGGISSLFPQYIGWRYIKYECVK